MNYKEEYVNSFILYTEQWPAIALLSDSQRSLLLQAMFALHGACEMPLLDDMTKAIFLLMKPRFDLNKTKYEEVCEKRREAGRKGGRPKKPAENAFRDESIEPNGSVSETKKPNAFLVKAKNPDTDSDPDPDPDFKNYPLPSWEEGRCAGEGVLTPRQKGTNPRSLGTNPRAAPAAPEQPGIGGTEADPPPADPAAMDLGFHEFLNAYPAAHREPVGEAAQVWKKLAREKSLPGLPRLLQGLDAWEDSHQWRKDDGAYIPKAANFLRRSMWLSAPPRAAPDEFWDAGAAMARLRAAAGNPLGAGGRL